MSSPAYPMDRTRPPIAEPNYPHSTVLDARDATPPPRFQIEAPWEMKPRATLQNDKWELYDTRNDFSLTNDLVAQKQQEDSSRHEAALKKALAD